MHKKKNLRSFSTSLRSFYIPANIKHIMGFLLSHYWCFGRLITPINNKRQLNGTISRYGVDHWHPHHPAVLWHFRWVTLPQRMSASWADTRRQRQAVKLDESSPPAVSPLSSPPVSSALKYVFVLPFLYVDIIGFGDSIPLESNGEA